MNFEKIKEFLTKPGSMSRGQVNPIGLILTIGGGIMAVAVIFFAMIQLGTALNNSNLTAMINNTLALGVNFTAQLPTVGTLLGVGLFLLVIFGGGFLAYSYIRGRGGGTGM